ncbi:putative sucrose transporter [Rosellinia necatrix]|uniref:Putative sucrose transporter n=1 Tax=Rosellinia necatrix TaxID=77044 RepID=A0A1W2TDV1_ROSNE|nr:putative sucrose transporter [Rosellinia necatrix]
MSQWLGQPSIKGSTEASRMALLTLSTIGITFVWGVEQTYCTPYLLSLGLTKSKTSLVWIAGPLSGLIVQPIVGTVADKSTLKWGRRRPFILTGAIITALFLLLLGFTEDIISFFVADKKSAQHLTVSAAVLAIYAVDFSINAVMSAARSLVVDTLPIEKQQTGSAWGSRMSAIGHGIAFATGAIDLPSLLGKSLGETQFKQLTVLAAFGLVATCSITCWAVTERVLLSTPKPNKEDGLYQVASHIWSTLLHLPPRIRAICIANFWAWIGWFPFLFYSTTWIGETYFRYDAPHSAKQSKDALGEVGRVGSKAFIIYSLITFFGSWFLPLVIKSPDDRNYTQRPPESLRGIVEKFNKYKPDLLTAWMCAHATFASAMLFAPFAKSFTFATILVCICGLPWNIASWAPHAFLGVEVNKLGSADAGSYRRLSNGSIEMADLSGGHLNTSLLHHERDNDNHHGTAKSSSGGEPSGVYFGILNIYTTIPQFIGTIISTVVFSILEPGKSPELAHGAHPDESHQTDGPNGVAVCLFIGALSAIAAIFATRRLKTL